MDSGTEPMHMVNSSIDIRSLGTHMPRRRVERGYVYKVGRRVKMWEGRYHVYLTLPDGSEKRRERTKILGPCAEMSKGDAQQALIRHIAIARGQAGPMPDNPTFRDLWTRYRTLKEPTWSTATKKAVVSLFEGKKPAGDPSAGPKKSRRPTILSMIGHRRVTELTRDPLQEHLNRMAARGDSFSAVKKARTYITAALEFALDEQLIGRNPGRKLELPSKRLPKRCGRFYSLEEVRRLLSAAAAASFRERLVVHLFVLCGLRAQELFVLRVDDIEPGILRIDEALRKPREVPLGLATRRALRVTAMWLSALTCRRSFALGCKSGTWETPTTRPRRRSQTQCCSPAKPERRTESGTTSSGF